MSKFLKVSGITVAVGAALYAGLGYFGVPYVARTVLERFGSTELGRTVAVKDIRFNPWTWRFELEGLSIKSQEGAGYFLTLDELAVDASGSTITNMAPVIEEVTVKGLHGTLTWSDENLKEAEKYESKDAPAETAADSALPAFAVYNVNVSDTSLRFVDKTRGIDQRIEDLTLALPFVSTLPAERESIVTPKLSLKLNGTPIVATGSTRPFGQSTSRNSTSCRSCSLCRLCARRPPTCKRGFSRATFRLSSAIPRGATPRSCSSRGRWGLTTCSSSSASRGRTLSF